MAYAMCEGCKRATVDLKKNHVVTATGYKHSPNCGQHPKPIEQRVQAGQPGPFTGNAVMELVEYKCAFDGKSTYIANQPGLVVFGKEPTLIVCAWCAKLSCEVVSTIHVEPLWFTPF